MAQMHPVEWLMFRRELEGVTTPMQGTGLKDLLSKTPAELVSFAEENGVKNASSMSEQELMFASIRQLAIQEKTEKPSFSNATVLHLAGHRLSAATLQNWANRGLLHPTIDTKNIKGRRRYSHVALVQAVLVPQLVDHFRIPPAEAVLIIAIVWGKLYEALLGRIRDGLEEMLRLRDPKYRVKIDFSVIEKLWVVHRASPRETHLVTLEEIPEALKSAKYAVVFPFGAELNKLAERAMRVHQEQQKVDDEDSVFADRALDAATQTKAT